MQSESDPATAQTKRTYAKRRVDRPWNSEMDYVRPTKEAARILGVCPETLRKMSEAGNGPKRIKLSARLYGYPDSGLREFIASRTEA